MRDTSKKPELFTPKSLVITTKLVAIYAAFNVVTVAIKSYVDAQAVENTIADEVQSTIYLIAGIHVLILLICGVMIMTKKYSWVITIACIILSLYTRFYFDNIVNWVTNF